MKLARLYAKRAGNGGNTIVCMRGGFHGRTLETIAATMQDWLQDSFRPLPGGFVACTPNDIDELRAIFKQLGSEICAVMLEPIQGESGVHPMTEEFMAAARDLAYEVGAVLIADEVQCGIFRSGKPFAFQTYGVEPDIMSLAKGIADGVPMGAVVAKKEIATCLSRATTARPLAVAAWPSRRVPRRSPHSCAAIMPTTLPSRRLYGGKARQAAARDRGTWPRLDARL